MSRIHLLTGATAGIGKAVYELLRDKGDVVIPIVRSKEKGERLGAEKYVVCDFANPVGVESVLGDFDDKIDSFINCAGTMIGKSIFEISAAQLIELNNVNVVSPLIAVGKLKENFRKGGVIILYGSQSGFRGSYDDGYAASKGAIHSFVKAVCTKVAPDLRIVGIAPGIVGDTRMSSEIFSGDKLAKKAKTIPLMITATSREMAELTDFIMSDSCRFMTGNMIDINGGLCLR